MNKTNINPIDRIQRIAMTGDITEPKPLSPVENIMQHYPKQETPEEGGFWNGVKNFASSKGGRMLLGGLGTAAAVGLTGGSLQNALGYGVIGAGKTAENIYNQEQDQKAWEEKEAERLFRQQESEANRKQQWDIAQANINAQKDARQDAYKHAETMLGLSKTNAIETKLAELKAVKKYKTDEILADPTLSDEQKQFAISQLNSDFDYDAYYTDKYYNGTPEQQAEAETYLARKTSYNNLVNPWDNLLKGADIAHKGGVVINPEAANEGRLEFVAKPQKLSDAQFAYQKALERGEDPLTAARSSGLDQFYNNGFELYKAIETENQKHQNEMKKQKDAQEHGVYMAGVNQGNDLEKLGYQHNLEQQGKEEDLRRQIELEKFKNSLPSPEKKAFEEVSAATGIPVEELYAEKLEEKRIARKKALADVEKIVAEAKRASSQAGLYSAQAQNVGKTPQINNFEYMNENDIPNASGVFGVKDPYAPSFSDVSSGVKEGTIAPEVGNQIVGRDVFQATTGKPKEQQQNLVALQGVENQLNNLEAMFDKLPQSKLSAYTGGAWRDLTGTLTQEEAEFNAQRTLLFNKIARDLGGEKGVLSDQDIKRVSDALPTIYDSPEQRAGKMAAVRNLLNIRKNQVNQGVGIDGGYGMPIGTIDGDYRYIGGDPKFEKSWELIQ
jgi:hypothetical protein